jgi:hypothetical protein
MPFSPFPKYHESIPFWYNDETITSAKATWTGSGSQFMLYLGTSSSFSGSYAWEEVTNGVAHSFVATGKFIKWKAVGLSYSLTSLSIVINA